MAKLGYEPFAMVVDEQGFAKHSRLYTGNQAERKTLAAWSSRWAAGLRILNKIEQL